MLPKSCSTFRDHAQRLRRQAKADLHGIQHGASAAMNGPEIDGLGAFAMQQPVRIGANMRSLLERGGAMRPGTSPDRYMMKP